jgi:drug/metabolite transporter (DMT)-like permease
MHWTLLALFSAIFWMSSDLLIRRALLIYPQNNTLAGLILMTSMAITFLIIGFATQKFSPHALQQFPKNIFAMLVVAGILNGIAYVFFLRFFSTGGTLTQGFSFLTALLVLFGAIGGILFFHDTFNLKVASGIGLTLMALYLLK